MLKLLVRLCVWASICGILIAVFVNINALIRFTTQVAYKESSDGNAKVVAWSGGSYAIFINNNSEIVIREKFFRNPFSVLSNNECSSEEIVRITADAVWEENTCDNGRMMQRRGVIENLPDNMKKILEEGRILAIQRWPELFKTINFPSGSLQTPGRTSGQPDKQGSGTPLQKRRIGEI